MSYTKTQWRNNQSPAINADNLNHIEQGVYDAHQDIAENTQNIESLTTQTGANTSAIALEKTERQQAVTAETLARESTDNNLQAQIDQLVAPSGTAPNPAEIENARIGADGVTYDTLGNAIRTQVTNLKSNLNDVLQLQECDLFSTASWEIGTLNSDDGTPVASLTRLRTTDFIDITDKTSFTIDVESGYRFAVDFYKSNGDLIKNLLDSTVWQTQKRTYYATDFANAVKIKVLISDVNNNNVDLSYASKVIGSFSYELIDATTDFESIKAKVNAEESLTFDVEFGKNLLTSNGTIVSASDYELSDYIPVSDGDILRVTAVWGGSASDNNLNGICGYASDKSFVIGLVNQYIALGLNFQRHLITDYEFVIPSGVSYIRGTSAYKDSTGNSYPSSPLILKKVVTTSLEYRVEQLEAEDNEKATDELVALSEFNTYLSGDASSSTAYKKLFTVSAFSDIHGATNQWRGFVSKTNKNKDYLDCAIFLGDVCGENPNSDIAFYKPSDSEVTFLSVVGNHDCADYMSVGISQSSIFTRYIKPCVDAGFISTSTPYYYKDFPSYNIRVIALMEYEGSVETANATSDNYRRYISSTQLQWFADTLYSTPSNYSVIVLLHQIVHTTPIIVDCKFTENSIYRQVADNFASGFGYQLNNMEGNPIGDIVQAFIEGSEINESYITTMLSQTLTSSVTKDFSQRGVGKFICYLAGHSHAPFVLKDWTYDNQIQILLPSDSDSYYQRKADDIRPQKGVPNFYYLAFDTTNKIIKVMKVGYRTTMNMVDRDFIAIPY